MREWLIHRGTHKFMASTERVPARRGYATKLVLYVWLEETWQSIAIVNTLKEATDEADRWFDEWCRDLLPCPDCAGETADAQPPLPF